MKLIRLPHPDPSLVITVNHNCMKRVVPVSDLLYCKSERNYTSLYFTDGTHCLDCKPLKDIKKELIPHGFLHIHKSFLVNGCHIRHYVTNGTSYVTLSNNTKLEISRRRISIVNRFFKFTNV